MHMSLWILHTVQLLGQLTQESRLNSDIGLLVAPPTTIDLGDFHFVFARGEVERCATFLDHDGSLSAEEAFEREKLVEMV